MLRRLILFTFTILAVSTGAASLTDARAGTAPGYKVYIPQVMTAFQPTRFIGLATNHATLQATLPDLQSLQAKTTHMALLHGPVAWDQYEFPAVSQQFALANGSTPYVVWEPGSGTGGLGPNNCDKTYSLPNIIGGRFDTYIRNFAAAAAASGHTLFLDFATEMNNNQMPWSGTCNGGANGGPQLYVQAYRHVHDLFVQQGAVNIVWVWTPIPGSYPNEAWNLPNNYYPGDAYVDWIGTKVFNWGASSIFNPNHQWATFEQLDNGFQDQMSVLHPTKPQIITEAGSVDGDGGTRAAWIASAFAALAKRPQVQAFIYYNYAVPNTVDGRAYDFRMENDPAAQQALRNGVQQLGMAQYLVDGVTTPSSGPRGTGASLGMYPPSSSTSDIGAFEQLAGKKHPLVITFADWAVPWSSPGGADWASAFRSFPADHVPLLMWQPNGISLATITSGQYDGFLANWAAGLKSWGRPFYIAWAPAPNNTEFPTSWDGGSNGGANGGPAAYRAAWRHIHDIFVRYGAANVRWVWMPGAADNMPPSYYTIFPVWQRPDSTWNLFYNYYPGDDVVDWIGTTVANYGDNAKQGTYWSPVVMQADRNLVVSRQRYPLKPQLTVLTSVEDQFDPTRKPGWITDAYNRMKTYPNVHAVVWQETIFGQTGLSIGSSQATLSAYQRAVADPYFTTTMP